MSLIKFDFIRENLEESLKLTYRPRPEFGRTHREGFNMLDNDHREHPEGDKKGAIWQLGISITW